MIDRQLLYCECNAYPPFFSLQEMVATVNENLQLRTEVSKLEEELQSQLQSHKQQMEETELTLNSLLKKKTSDEAAIASLVTNIQELRADKIKVECRLADLEKELEESRKEVDETSSNSDALVSL